jgi:hypothetical protein
MIYARHGAETAEELPKCRLPDANGKLAAAGSIVKFASCVLPVQETEFHAGAFPNRIWGRGGLPPASINLQFAFFNSHFSFS